MPRYDGPAALAGAAEAGHRVYAGQRPRTTIGPNTATRPTWGEPPAAQWPRTMALVPRRPLVKGALRGFATVELPIGLKLVDRPILVSQGKAWVSLPSKPALDHDGRQKTDANGKPAYVTVLTASARWSPRRFARGTPTRSTRAGRDRRAAR
jgi:hypothetical protein